MIYDLVRLVELGDRLVVAFDDPLIRDCNEDLNWAVPEPALHEAQQIFSAQSMLVIDE